MVSPGAAMGVGADAAGWSSLTRCVGEGHAGEVAFAFPR